MSKIEKTIIIITIAIAITAVTIVILKEKLEVGNIFTNPDTYTVATYSTNTLNTGAEEVLSRATSSRSFVRICNMTNEAPIYLYKQATSTGVVVEGGGYPIIATSTIGYENCMTINSADPYIGAVWAISSASTTVGIESSQE